MTIGKATREVRDSIRSVDTELDDLDADLVDIWDEEGDELAHQLGPVAEATAESYQNTGRLDTADLVALLSGFVLSASRRAASVTNARLDSAVNWGAIGQARALVAQGISPAGLSDARLSLIADQAARRIDLLHVMNLDRIGETAVTQIRAGLAAGLNPNQVARAIIRESLDEFEGGLTRARMIARTEMLDAYREAAMLTQLANRKHLAGWIWWAELSGRTCSSCISMHGSEHPLEEPGPLDHHQGRCGRVPVANQPGRDALAEEGEKARNSRDAFFAGLSEADQRAILGKRGFEQWKAGNWPMHQWSRRRVNPGWRDSYVKATPPKTPLTGGAGGPKKPGGPKVPGNTPMPEDPLSTVTGAKEHRYTGPMRPVLARMKQAAPAARLDELKIAPKDDPYKYATGSDKVSIATFVWLEKHGAKLRSVALSDSLPKRR